ncbi:auxin-responsive protein [Populus alba x Populus x berolinensis]|nr:auxin-responsive protein [Populus alba x Populus x berolinensis]
MSEEEFGVSSDRPITLPCDSEYMNYILSLIKRGEAKDFEKVLLTTLKMISAKKLIKLARKWQKLAAIRRKRLTLPQTISSLDSDDRSTSSTAEKGHFVVYTTDKKRFVLPLNYLNNEIVRELFNLAEEEFGLTSDGPITLPCDATFMEYAITLIQQNVAKDIEKALLVTIASNRCSSSLYLHHDVRHHQLSICSF